MILLGFFAVVCVLAVINALLQRRRQRNDTKVDSNTHDSFELLRDEGSMHHEDEDTFEDIPTDFRSHSYWNMDDHTCPRSSMLSLD
jgi:hypothetical protein